MAGVEAAKNAKAAAEDRLLLSLDTLRTLNNGPAERRPGHKIRRHLASVRADWEKFDRAHFAYMEVLTVEASKVIEREAFKVQYETAEVVMEAAEDLLFAMEPPPAPPRQQADDNVLYGIAEHEQKAIYTEVESQLEAIETRLQPAETGEAAHKQSKEELDQIAKQLDTAELHMKAAKVFTQEKNKLKPEQAVTNIDEEAVRNRGLARRIDEQRILVATRLSTIVAVVRDDRGRQRQGDNTYMYKRRDKPTFDGQKRNYPAFKREWTTGITGRFDEDYEVREIKLNVPKEIEPDIKNLTSMEKVWKVLDERYGKVIELTADLISDIQCFSFSKQATNN